MAFKVSCPQCETKFGLTEAFPGSRVFCPACRSCIILNIQVKTPEKSVVVSKTPVVVPEDISALRAQSLYHLANWLDITAAELGEVLNKIGNNEGYTIWNIPKGNGGCFRKITAPCEPLKRVQRRILDRLLYRIPVSNAAHGFVPGRSIVTNAQSHLHTANSILNVDLKDAFPSVSETRVKHLYVRYLKIPLKHLGQQVAPAVLNDVIDCLLKFTTHNGCLPQGGPCSGYLLNLACISLDKNIYRLLSKYGSSYHYTRYADDITISTPLAMAEEFCEKLTKVILNCGFQVNPQKCHYADRSKGQKLEVTGLILEKNKVRIPAHKLETFRAVIHQASLVAETELTPEKKLEIQSIVAFVKMVYNRLPHRIWGPYKTYMEKHDIRYPRRASKMYLDLYSG